MSGFPVKKTLDDFDFSFLPPIDKRQIDELATNSLSSSKKPILRTACWTSSGYWPSIECSSSTRLVISPWTFRAPICSSSSLLGGMRKRPPSLPPTRPSPSGTRSLPTLPSPPLSWIAYCITAPLSTSTSIVTVALPSFTTVTSTVFSDTLTVAIGGAGPDRDRPVPGVSAVCVPADGELCAVVSGTCGGLAAFAPALFWYAGHRHPLDGPLYHLGRRIPAAPLIILGRRERGRVVPCVSLCHLRFGQLIRVKPLPRPFAPARPRCPQSPSEAYRPTSPRPALPVPAALLGPWR